MRTYLPKALQRCPGDQGLDDKQLSADDKSPRVVNPNIRGFGSVLVEEASLHGSSLIPARGPASSARAGAPMEPEAEAVPAVRRGVSKRAQRAYPGESCMQGRLMQPELPKATLYLLFTAQPYGKDSGEVRIHSEALDVGNTESEIRTFLDQGGSLRTLIERWLEPRFRASRSTAMSPAGDISGRGDERFAGRSGRVPGAKISPRERQLLSLLDEGLSNAQLAQRCMISEGTVKWYLHNLYEKFSVGNRTALVRAARDAGLTRETSEMPSECLSGLPARRGPRRAGLR